MLSNLEELAEPSLHMFLSKRFTYGIRRPINFYVRVVMLNFSKAFDLINYHNYNLLPEKYTYV